MGRRTAYTHRKNLSTAWLALNQMCMACTGGGIPALVCLRLADEAADHIQGYRPVVCLCGRVQVSRMDFHVRVSALCSSLNALHIDSSVQLAEQLHHTA